MDPYGHPYKFSLLCAEQFFFVFAKNDTPGILRVCFCWFLLFFAEKNNLLRTQQGKLVWMPIWVHMGTLWLLTSWRSVRLKQNTSRKLSRLLPGLWDITFGPKWTKILKTRFLARISYIFLYKKLKNRSTASTYIYIYIYIYIAFTLSFIYGIPNVRVAISVHPTETWHDAFLSQSQNVACITQNILVIQGIGMLTLYNYVCCLFTWI